MVVIVTLLTRRVNGAFPPQTLWAHRCYPHLPIDSALPDEEPCCGTGTGTGRGCASTVVRPRYNVLHERFRLCLNPRIGEFTSIHT